jgi:hypothetical protein
VTSNHSLDVIVDTLLARECPLFAFDHFREGSFAQDLKVSAALQAEFGFYCGVHQHAIYCVFQCRWVWGKAC